eukprot:m.211604 g.211604  ORF g.211604 m.211604 type:complete len:70 (+) comp15840_c2_seq9:273-482(+)
MRGRGAGHLAPILLPTFLPCSSSTTESFSTKGRRIYGLLFPWENYPYHPSATFDQVDTVAPGPAADGYP